MALRDSLDWQEADMDDPSMPATEPPPIPRGRSRDSRLKSKSRMPRPLFIVIACLLILIVGWGAFSISARHSVQEDDAELADLDGFESPPTSLGGDHPQNSSGESEPNTSSSGPGFGFDQATAGRASNWPAHTGNGSSPPVLVPVSSFPGVQTATFESGQYPAASSESASGAWLMGIIEEATAPANIRLPSRVATGLMDGPAIR
jgi:hypothetical protein